MIDQGCRGEPAADSLIRHIVCCNGITQDPMRSYKKDHTGNEIWLRRGLFCVLSDISREAVVESALPCRGMCFTVICQTSVK